MVTHPIMILQKHMTRLGIQPIEVIMYLFGHLQHSHATHATGLGGFGNSANNTANVGNEIAGWMSMTNTNDAPPSVLAALELMVKGQHWMDSHNAKNSEQRGDKPQAMVTGRNAKIGEMLLLSIREMINEGDKQGIDYTLKLEELAKKEGWTLNWQKPKAEPDAQPDDPAEEDDDQPPADDPDQK